MSLGNSASINNTVSSLTSAATGTSAGAASSRQTIAQNFDAFLNLLTTQLRNQDPSSPLDANQFTQQLVQFSGVEQQLRSNDLLTTISKNIGGSGSGGSAAKLNAASAASLIGTQVSADAGTARLSPRAGGGSGADYPVTIPPGTRGIEVAITNAAGEEVYRGNWSPPGSGEQVFNWDGKRASGIAVDASGAYTISVTGQSASGLQSRLSTERSGIVNSVDISGTEEQVQFGNFTLPLSQIKKVSRAPG
ncbi:MAG: flagellar hook assembly protein FlgD [Beijerinckiaceae bacterium]